MGVLALLNHAINFLAPAAWLAFLLPLLSRIFMRKMALTNTLYVQVALHFVVGCAVLLLGLMVFGRDGKMLTYLVLVLLAATTQWCLLRRG